MRVVGCVPVPKARPGSRRITSVAPAGTSCQVGTIQKLGVMGTGSNCDCVRRTQSCSGTGAIDATSQPSQKSCSASSRAASRACASSPNRATMRERDQLCAGGGRPGSPNSARSASVSASASSTDTLNASSASSASDSGSTRSSGQIRRNSNMTVSLLSKK